MQKRSTVGFLVLMLVFGVIGVPAHAAQTVNEQYPVSSGVKYSQYTYKNSSTNVINHLSINLNDPYTKVDLGLPSTYNSRDRVTSLATKHSVEGNRVVGAINAAFFDTSEGNPLFLIAKNNQIINGGIVTEGADQYMNVPTAFGINQNGQGIIDYFDFDINLSRDGKTYELSGMDRVRNAGEVIVYTPLFYKGHTDTNEFGYEIIVEGSSNIANIAFGDTISGTVKAIAPYGESKHTIPKNGFIISIQGGSNSAFSDVKVGEKIDVSFSVDKKWDKSQFILASGPMLVRDGKPYIMMSTSSSRAKEIAPRTVVASSADKKTVHYITVDGRQTHSKGMNMVQLANYLVELGVDTAINLDGGGSTAMGIRKYGSNNVVLANKPSDGSERRVNAILEAVSTAPTGVAKTMKYTRTNVGTMLKGTSSTITVQHVLDQYYNPLSISKGEVTLKSVEGTLTINGTTFTTTKAGSDYVYINHNGKAVQSFPVTIVDAPASMSISGSNKVSNGSSSTYTVKALDASGKNLIYNASQLQWSVQGNIGTITTGGKFTATKPGKGSIVAKLGTKTVSYPIEVPEKSIFTDISVSHPYYEQLKYLAEKGYVAGYADGSFKPNNELTRAHGAVIISKVMGLDTTNITNPEFTDVSTAHMYYKQIAAVQNAKIMGGKEDGSFDPNGKLTRAQMAVIIANAFELSGISSTQFSDVPSDSGAYPFVQALAKNNITVGYSDGTYKPNSYITRAHFGLFIYNALKLK
ncbi:S-layer homology domain-containing protein [Ureibacillus chungkukjangi]|uniref:S-layer family protein n=1 Tax=Ureibacillus chungkukjangi TaxID=1202712 RepID=A0A318TUP8_9BACL|nr:S-layer homology domain-containing protein [Ureibacillus chungkukjangi]PYF07590.1 S-layer family protein [Ureibacillus chungkukjangi]